jgi:hypothetical protein
VAPCVAGRMEMGSDQMTHCRGVRSRERDGEVFAMGKGIINQVRWRTDKLAIITMSTSEAVVMILQ